MFCLGAWWFKLFGCASGIHNAWTFTYIVHHYVLFAVTDGSGETARWYMLICYFIGGLCDTIEISYNARDSIYFLLENEVLIVIACCFLYFFL